MRPKLNASKEKSIIFYNSLKPTCDISKKGQFSLPQDYVRELDSIGANILYGRLLHGEIHFSPFFRVICPELPFLNEKESKQIVQKMVYDLHKFELRKGIRNQVRICIPPWFRETYFRDRREGVLVGLRDCFLLQTPNKYVEDYVTGEVLISLLRGEQPVKEVLQRLVGEARIRKKGIGNDWDDINPSLEEILKVLEREGLIKINNHEIMLTDRGKNDATAIEAITLRDTTLLRT